jgi:hypothetical protein
MRSVCAAAAEGCQRIRPHLDRRQPRCRHTEGFITADACHRCRCVWLLDDDADGLMALAVHRHEARAFPWLILRSIFGFGVERRSSKWRIEKAPSARYDRLVLSPRRAGTMNRSPTRCCDDGTSGLSHLATRRAHPQRLIPLPAEMQRHRDPRRSPQTVLRPPPPTERRRVYAGKHSSASRWPRACVRSSLSPTMTAVAQGRVAGVRRCSTTARRLGADRLYHP